MTHAKDPAPDASGPGGAGAWLAGIKAEAARRQAARDVAAMTEDELLDEAARGIAARRAARHDLIGALAWEEIAERGRTPDTAAHSESAESRADGSGSPAAERTGRD